MNTSLITKAVNTLLQSPTRIRPGGIEGGQSSSSGIEGGQTSIGTNGESASLSQNVMSSSVDATTDSAIQVRQRFQVI